MPRAPQQCPTHGCPEAKPCPKHPPPRRWDNSTRNQRNPPAWNALRLTILKRDSWHCQIADPDRCTGAATEVDHIDGDSTNHAKWNLQAVCNPCHSAKTHREGVAARWHDPDD